MKKLLQSLSLTSLLLIGNAGMAQLADGTVAPNFTLTDMNGKKHDLYGYLNAGKSVVIDISATWCGPCWDYHKSGELEKFYTNQGSSGTNKAMVIFIEGDGDTDDNDMKGTGSNTKGNWLNGTPYPMCNPQKADADKINTDYKIKGFPTMYLICAANKKVKDVSQYTSAQLTSSLNACPAVTTTITDTQFDFQFSVTSSNKNLTVTVGATDNNSIANIKVFNMLGSMLFQSSQSNFANANYDMSKFSAGIYILQVEIQGKRTSKKFVLN
jgi:hypothetical protein